MESRLSQGAEPAFTPQMIPAILSERQHFFCVKKYNPNTQGFPNEELLQ
jgi:hypothetical protein